LPEFDPIGYFYIKFHFIPIRLQLQTIPESTRFDFLEERETNKNKTGSMSTVSNQIHKSIHPFLVELMQQKPDSTTLT